MQQAIHIEFVTMVEALLYTEIIMELVLAGHKGRTQMVHTAAQIVTETTIQEIIIPVAIIIMEQVKHAMAKVHSELAIKIAAIKHIDNR